MRKLAPGRNPIDRSQTVEANPFKIKTEVALKVAMQEAHASGQLETIVDRAMWTMREALRYIEGREKLANGMFGRLRQALTAEM